MVSSSLSFSFSTFALSFLLSLSRFSRSFSTEEPPSSSDAASMNPVLLQSSETLVRSANLLHEIIKGVLWLKVVSSYGLGRMWAAPFPPR